MADPREKILIVDDDADLLQLLSMRLTSAGFEVETADCAEAAVNRLDLVRPQLVITDMRMKEMDGMALFEHIHRTMPALPVIILTAHGTIPDAVAATQRGVFGYLTKPFDSTVLLDQVKRALRVSAGAARRQSDWRADIITQSPVVEDLLARAELVAQGDASVVIRGESGTGKELLARAIHNASGRSGKPFVAINCAAIPEQLLESELFGYVKGAFTGAVRDHKGLFQAAEGGTIFLDEIGDMPLDLQGKLLRVLQEREFQRLGSSETIPLDARVIAASNRDLTECIRQGAFREDLYYRLNVVPVEMPPLRDRPADIPLLVRHFIARFCREEGMPPKRIAREAMDRLCAYSWPGNVRQLENAVEMAIALSGSAEELHAADFPLPAPARWKTVALETVIRLPEDGLDFERTVSGIERNILGQALERTRGNKKAAADMLRLKRTTLAAKLKSLEMAT